MVSSRRLVQKVLASAIIFAALITSPAQAARYVIYDVAFFERVIIGNVEVTPVNLIRDSRCVDKRLCLDNDQFIVSVVLHQFDGLTEVILQQDRFTPVQDGFLVLRSAGTAPRLNGAIPLHEYGLELEYYSYDEVVLR